MPECTRMYPNVPECTPIFRPNVPDHGFDALLESCRVVVVWQWWFQRADFFRCTAWQFSVAQELIPGSNDFASCQCVPSSVHFDVCKLSSDGCYENRQNYFPGLERKPVPENKKRNVFRFRGETQFPACLGWWMTGGEEVQLRPSPGKFLKACSVGDCPHLLKPMTPFLVL